MVASVTLGSFPKVRMRRNRSDAWLRRLVAESQLTVNDLVWPLFVQEGEGKCTPITSMPGVERRSPDLLVEEAVKAAALGIPAIALFPSVDAAKKSPEAEEAFNPNNLVSRTVRMLKQAAPDIGIICDVALDPYTTHGHDGLLRGGDVANDLTIAALIRQALVLADAGCDVIAPSDMMDGRVGAIRSALDARGHQNVKILSYAVKYASCFYGPFRDAVGSKTSLGGSGKHTYQMNPANVEEALREAALDVAEGADMLMVKPGMPYLDVIHRVREACKVPVFAYQVSGEYAMLRAAADAGWLDWRTVMLESLLAFKRAGARGIFTYAAAEAAEILKHG